MRLSLTCQTINSQANDICYENIHERLYIRSLAIYQCLKNVYNDQNNKIYFTVLDV